MVGVKQAGRGETQLKVRAAQRTAASTDLGVSEWATDRSKHKRQRRGIGNGRQQTGYGHRGNAHIGEASHPGPRGAHAEAQDEQMWTCQNCTLQNPRIYLSCEVCGQPESVPEEGWRCKDCQEDNATWSTKCKCSGERYLQEGGWWCDRCKQAVNPVSSSAC